MSRQTFKSFADLLLASAKEKARHPKTLRDATLKELLPIVAQLREKTFTYKEISEWLIDRADSAFTPGAIEATLKDAQERGYFTNAPL